MCSENNSSQSVPCLFIDGAKILILMQSTLPIFLSQITLFYFFTPEFLSGLKHPDVLSSWDWLHPSLLKRVNKLINPQSKASFFSFFQADYSNLLICFYLFIHSFIFRLCWVFVAAWAGPFSSCSERGLLSSCTVKASNCSDFSVAEHGLWGMQASVSRAHGLSSLCLDSRAQAQ